MSKERLLQNEDEDLVELDTNYGSIPGTAKRNLANLRQKMMNVKMPQQRDMIRRCIAEFLGCLIFIYIGSLSGTSGADVIGAALAHGVCIAVLIIGLGHISGGHFNPAVTVGVLVSGEIHFVLAIFYWIAQLLGGFVGALLVKASIKDVIYLNITGGTTNINPANATIAEAIVMEAVLTFLLVHTVLNAAVDSGGTNVLAPLGIGFALLVSIFAGGNVSGASLNPARSFGPALSYQIFENCNQHSGDDFGKKPCMTSSEVWKYHYVHWVGPVIGGVIAGIVYKMLFAKTGKRWILN